MRDTLVNELVIADLRPTQMTIGRREVEVKRRQWRETKDQMKLDLLGRHAVPTILGPKKRHYVLDHHHLALALLEEGETTLFGYIVADLHHLEKDAFWVMMDNSAWCHPYDAKGRRQSISDIPKDLTELSDDPYRSLAGELRRSGGYAKSDKPFVEFIWADFLRRRIDRELVQDQFASALSKALELCKTAEADYLPGWCASGSD